MPDFDNYFKKAEFTRKEILPYLRHSYDHEVPFSDYMLGMYLNKPRHFYKIVSPYVYYATWLPRFKDKCVDFYDASPEEISRGCGQIICYYQIAPDCNALMSVGVFDDDGSISCCITGAFFYESLNNVLKFWEDNLDIVKKQDKRAVGFGAAGLKLV